MNVDDHYKGVAKSYEDALFYQKGNDFEKQYFAAILKTFSIINLDTKIVDLGGGTGRIANLLYSSSNLRNNVICVDNSEDMLSVAKTREGVDAVHCNGMDYFKGIESNSVDRVLLKEFIHHVPIPSLNSLFSNIYNAVSPGGIVLVITRCKKGIEYPFSKKAIEVWEQNQEAKETYEDEMKACGFTVHSELFTYTLNTTLDFWLKMVENRFWSTFGPENFTEEQLKDTIEEIRTKYHNESGNIEFNEKIIFIIGTK